MADAQLQIGIVLEAKDHPNPLVDKVWRVVQVVPGLPGNAGGLTLQLFKRETEGYKVNLSQNAPVVYVVLKPDDADADEMVPFLATVCPYEAENYTESGELQVDPVPMPAEVTAWVADFVERFHVDQVFKKRKRDPQRGRRG